MFYFPYKQEQPAILPSQSLLDLNQSAMLSLVLWLMYALQVPGHSWVEEHSVVADGLLKGSPGYPRGYGKAKSSRENL